MPRQLKEIRNFGFGTILNQSESDIPSDAAAYSLNVNPLSEDGILSGIENDKFFLSSNSLTSTVSKGIRWAPYNVSDSTKKGESAYIDTTLPRGLGTSSIYVPIMNNVSIDDISLFDNKSLCKIGYIGTKGLKETVIADKIQPYLEPLLYSTTLYDSGLEWQGATTATPYTVAATINAQGQTYWEGEDYGMLSIIHRKLFNDSGVEVGTAVDYKDDNEIYFHCINSTVDDGDINLRPVVTLNPATTINPTDIEIPFRSRVVAVNDTQPTDTCYVCRLDTDGSTLGGLTDSEVVITTPEEGVAKIKFVSATPSDYDEYYIEICSPNGHKTRIDLEAQSTDINSFNRTQDPVAVTCGLYLNTNQAQMAADFAGALNTVMGLPLQEKLATTEVGDNGADTVVITFQDTLGSQLSEGDYISLTGRNDTSTSDNQDFSTIGGLYDIGNEEIMLIESIDTTLNKISVKRGVFGTPVKSYEPITRFAYRDYVIYANRMTIDGEQLPTTKCSARLTNFSDRSGNHIGGPTYDAANESLQPATYKHTWANANGYFVPADTAKGLVFDSDSKTLTLGTTIEDNVITAGNFNIEEGDWIYYHGKANPDGTSTNIASNNGFKAKVLKKEFINDKIVLTFDKAPLSATIAHGTTTVCYLDNHLITNGYFEFKNSEATSAGAVGVAVGDGEEYKLNEWKHVEYVETVDGYIQNKYGYHSTWTTDANVIQEAGSAVHAPDKRWFAINNVGKEQYYPYVSAPSHLKLTAEYLPPAISADSDETKLQIDPGAEDTRLVMKSNVEGVLAVNDILKYGNEYMNVVSMSGNEVIVERGYLSSTAAAHSVDTESTKCTNVGVQQTIPKYKLKAGQSYSLTFYAKSDDHATDYAYGGLSLRVNGGYFDINGVWKSSSSDTAKGYNVNKNDIMQEERWLNFEQLEKPNGDLAKRNTLVDYIHPAALDDIWRKFKFTFHMPTTAILDTDLTLNFANRGVNNSILYIDEVDLIENTILYNINNKTLLNTSSFIDNSGVKDLISYDSVENKLKVAKKIFKEEYNEKVINPADWEFSNFASTDIRSSDGSAVITPNNREVHIGFGGGKETTSPQWLGYVNHKFFGQDFSNELYQDEDTIHTYDEKGTGSLSKMCVAGEYERVECSYNTGTGVLTITFNPQNLIKIGDVIVVREWMDSDNSWDGNGVWGVVGLHADGVTNFTCKRQTTDSFNPTDNKPELAPQDNLICFRPYFYYGIKDGEPAIYRIWPDLKLDDDGVSYVAEDTGFTRGKVEKSLPISMGPTSICTFYNKGPGGNTSGLGDSANQNGGGRVYILSAHSNEAMVIDVTKRYDEWTTSKLNEESDIDLKFKSFKWSNERIDGNITQTKGVFGPVDGIAVQSTPTIEYSGILSDILETKAPNETYDIDADVANSDTITTSMFDTRLWIQTRPGSGDDGFSEGDRFLFAGLSTAENTEGPTTLYLGDRTPPTTVVTRTPSRYSTGGHKFNAGPGVNPGVSPRSYFQHKYEGGDSAHKFSRLSALKEPGLSHSGQGGSIQAQHTHKPYINFGYNVGWDVETLPSIQVAKHGIFQLADNDGDGVIDGTGLISPNNISIPSGAGGVSEDFKTGPWGRKHQRVCGHAVGLIGGSVASKWFRHWGRQHAIVHAPGSHDYFISNYGNGPYEDAPECMVVDKLLFISSDTHYGDFQPRQSYAWTACAAAGGDANTHKTELTFAATTEIETLEVGDLVYLVPAAGTSLSTTVTKIIKSTNKIWVAVDHENFNSGSTTTGTVWPFAPHMVPYWNIGGVMDEQEMFHFSYSHEDPTSSSVFRPGEGSGHYARKFMTLPAYWGGPITSSGTDGGNPGTLANPGIMWPLERLSYKAGVMMRPFAMDNGDFDNLILGQGTAIDMPCWPNNVFHIAANSSPKIHYNIGNNNAEKNMFASRLFIANEGENQTSKMFICDLEFMYPDLSHQIEETTTNGSYGTNNWNNTSSHDIAFKGTLGSTPYSASLDDDTNLHRNAPNNPVLTLDPDNISGPNDHIFTANYFYRLYDNFLYGLCITVKDATTGMCQTRQITGSIKAGTASGDNMYISVHYPFAHEPASGDEFWVWKHSMVATAPVRLFKETVLPHEGFTNAIKAGPIPLNARQQVYSGFGSISNITSDGNTWVVTTSTPHQLSDGDEIEIYNTTNYNNATLLVNKVASPQIIEIESSTNVATETSGDWRLPSDGVDSEASVANPLTMHLSRPIMSVHFGGLDMRKLKYGYIDSVDGAHGTADVAELSTINTISGVAFGDYEQTLDSHSHCQHAGDMITLLKQDANANFEGTYYVKARGGSTAIDIYDTSADTANDYFWFTNQWQMLIAGTTSRSEMGELRSGLTQWDRGATQGNIQRGDIDDPTTDAAFEARFINFGESSFTVTAQSLGDATGDFFVKNNRYFYKVSFIYDGYQEGPLSDSYWSFYDSQSRSKLAINIKVPKQGLSRRLSHICVYRKDTNNDFYKLVKEIPTESGWTDDGEYYSYLFGDEGDIGSTYEMRTGIPEVLDTIKIKYGIASEIDGYLFVGDCSHTKINNASNLIFRSKPGKFSVFDYTSDFQTLKSKPTAMANFNGRLYVFDNTNIYRINPQNLAIEDIYEGVGCTGKDSVIVTEYGMFFADKNGAYMHNGSRPVKISAPIQKGGDTESEIGGTDNIKDLSWNNTVTRNPNAKPYVMYDPSNNSILFTVEIDSNVISGVVESSSISQYIWSFSLDKKRWDLFELSKDSKIGKPFYGDKGEVYIPVNDSIFEHRGGTGLKDYTWISKKLTMGEDSIMKVYNKIKLNGLSQDIKLGGDYLESSDRIIVLTSNGDVSSSNITLASSHTENIDYRLKGSNKRGRWVQVKLENMTESLDSVGFIFRRKSTK